MIKKVLLILLSVLIIIQLFHPAKNSASGAEGTSNDISHKYTVPENVKSILKISCNDCHSNNTVYPWYSKIQPVDWWLDNHIKEGKKELNFNEFLTYNARKQFHKMEEIEEQVNENEMPLSSYTIIHKDAKLSDAQKQMLIDWSKAIRENMKSIYPKDSLIKK